MLHPFVRCADTRPRAAGGARERASRGGRGRRARPALAGRARRGPRCARRSQLAAHGARRLLGAHAQGVLPRARDARRAARAASRRALQLGRSQREAQVRVRVRGSARSLHARRRHALHTRST